MPLLDPRYYQINDLLRRPYEATTPILSSGRGLAAEATPGWGFAEGVYWRTPSTLLSVAPLTLTIRADGEYAEPGGGIYRPAYVTQNAIAPMSGLQVTEDRFIGANDVAVSIVSVRNPDDMPVAVRIDHSYGVPSGRLSSLQEEDVWVHREGPPGDDLRFRLNPRSMRTLVFGVGFGDSEEQARRRVWRWRNHLDPVALQCQDYQEWFSDNAPGFDCSDPWFVRLWYHRWAVARRNGIDGDLPGDTDLPRLTTALSTEDERRANLEEWTAFCRAQFMGGEFDHPYISPLLTATADGADDLMASSQQCRWAERLLVGLIGMVPRSDNILELHRRLPLRNWGHFCIENLLIDEQRVTLVWDDPEVSEDAYNDGDKGFTIYLNGTRIYHSEQWTDIEVELKAPPIDEDF